MSAPPGLITIDVRFYCQPEEGSSAEQIRRFRQFVQNAIKYSTRNVENGYVFSVMYEGDTLRDMGFSGNASSDFQERMEKMIEEMEGDGGD